MQDDKIQTTRRAKRRAPISPYREAAEDHGPRGLPSCVELPPSGREKALYNAALWLVTLLDASPGIVLTDPIHMHIGEVCAVLRCYKAPRL